MDILTRERSKLEVLQCSSLVLLPNTITILSDPTTTISDTIPISHPGATHRVILDIKYADITFSVLVTLDHPLDFLVTTQDLLPMKYLDNKSFPPKYPNTSLVELIRWLITNMKQYMETRILQEKELSNLVTAIENLINMNIISKDSYEVAMVGDRAILIVKFRPEKDIKIASIKEMVKEDKLLNTGGHFFVLKMVFRVDTGAFLPGEFSIAFSSDLSQMLPELAEFSHPGLTAKLASDLVSFIIYVKEAVDKTIWDAVEGWEERGKLLLSLHSIFAGGDLAVAYLDSPTMCNMDLAFRNNLAKQMLKIELSPTYPAVVPKITWFSSVNPVEEDGETRISGKIKERVLKVNETGITKDLDQGDAVQAVLNLINSICSSERN